MLSPALYNPWQKVSKKSFIKKTLEKIEKCIPKQIENNNKANEKQTDWNRSYNIKKSAELNEIYTENS